MLGSKKCAGVPESNHFPILTYRQTSTQSCSKLIALLNVFKLRQCWGIQKKVPMIPSKIPETALKFLVRNQRLIRGVFLHLISSGVGMEGYALQTALG